MTDINITAWKKYGHHRGYATATDGTKLGWIDVPTGAITLETAGDAHAVGAALVAWRDALGLAPAVPSADPSVDTPPPREPGPTRAPEVVAPPPVCTEEPSSPALVPEPVTAATFGQPTAELPPLAAPAPAPPEAPEWQDLSLHRPGELVRAEALAEWEASKERSRLRAYGARVFNVHTQERAWRVGADGEEVIGSRLEKLLSKGWYVLHSVPVGSRGSDIDHIVIGPGGVFTINSKNHPGAKIWVAKYQMRVNGQPVDYLRNARHEGQRASKLLTAATGFPVEVRSCVVVLTNTFVPNVTYKQMPDDVMVLDRMDIPGWFKRRKRVLTDDRIDAIYDVARRSTTWVTPR